MQDGSKKAILAALVANLCIAVAKLTAAIITGSASMLAETIHSVADAGNQGLLFLGGRRAARPASARHSFGYGAERYFWSFVVALVLFSMGALFSIYEGISKLSDPHDVESPTVAFVVLGIAVLLEIYSTRTAIQAARPYLNGRSWFTFIRTTKNPELPVVLLEDIGALFGLVFALAGLALTVATGDPRFDAYGSLAIGTLLGVIASILAVEMKSLLIGESALESNEAGMRTTIESSPEVRSIIHLRTRHLGPEEILLAAKVDFAVTEVAALARAIDAVETRVRAEYPEVTVIYLEPDLDRSRPPRER